MSRRNKSRPRGAQPNTEAVSVQDAFSNPLFRLGYGSQSPLEATEYPLTRMTDNYALLNSLYRDNWVVQNVVGIIPDDMTKKWFALAGAVGPEHLKELDRVQRVTALRERVNEGLRWGRLYGGAAGLIMIRGQEGMLGQPLELESIYPGTFQGLYILDRWQGVVPGMELVFEGGEPVPAEHRVEQPSEDRSQQDDDDPGDLISRVAAVADDFQHHDEGKNGADQIKIKEQSAEYTVVLDDLQNLTDTTERENYFEVIRKLLSLNNVWLILIARCPFPRWLLPLRTKYIFAEIEESDFLFSLDEQITYLEQYDIHLTREEHQKAWNLGGGNALSLLFFVMEKGNLELTQRRQWDYLETHVYDQWDLELQEFFMDISIVETFTVRLASMLTGRSDVEKLIFRAEEVGNFFDIRGTDGIWKCRWPMRKSMQQRLRRKRSIEQINHLYYTAGLYYELEEKPLEALSMYEKYNDMESISRLLISNARKNPSSGHFYELRKYYLKLPEELISGSPVLMAGISLLQSMLMNIEESNRWYHQLEKFAEEHSGSMKKEALSRLLYLKISLPHTGTANMIDLLKNADLLIHNKKVVFPELSVTSNLPSMMNGGKDFCEWSKRDTELALTIGKSVEFVLEKYGKGLVYLALAESYLEKGKDIFEIFSKAEKGRMDAERGGYAGTGFCRNRNPCMVVCFER